VFDLLKLTRLAMAATFLAVAIAPSPAGAQQAAAPTITDKSPTGELTYWNSVKDTTDVSNFKAYLENFPNGMFYDLALAKFTSLGGNAADLKPVAKGSFSASGNSTKSKAVVPQKSVILTKARKKPRTHVAKKVDHKHIVHHKRLKLRKVTTPSNDQFGSGRGSGGGKVSGGGGGGSGGGWGH